MLRKYEAGDLEKIRLQPTQEVERNESWRAFASINSLVFADGDNVLAIIYPHEEYGTITLYSLVGKDSGYKSVSIVKTMIKWIKEQFSRSDVNRICMTTQADFDNANRLARMLGFSFEGTMHSFFKGIDFNIWGIWK